MQRPDTVTRLPSREALILTVEVLAGRMTRQRAVNQLAEGFKRPVPARKS